MTHHPDASQIDTATAGSPNSYLGRLFDRLISAVEISAAFGIAAIALLVTYEVVLRYVLNSPTSWTQDVCIYLLLWIAFLGLAPAERAGDHIRIDLLLRKLPASGQRRIGRMTYLLVAAFSILVAWSGFDAALQSYRYGRLSLSLLPIPIWIPQACVPIGMCLFAVECVRRAFGGFGELDRPR